MRGSKRDSQGTSPLSGSGQSPPQPRRRGKSRGRGMGIQRRERHFPRARHRAACKPRGFRPPPGNQSAKTGRAQRKRPWPSGAGSVEAHLHSGIRSMPKERKGITDTKSAAIVPSVPTCGTTRPEPLSEHRRTGTGRQARAPTGCGASQSEAPRAAAASELSHAEVAPTAPARAVAGEKERNNRHEKGGRLFRASRPAERQGRNR